MWQWLSYFFDIMHLSGRQGSAAYWHIDVKDLTNTQRKLTDTHTAIMYIYIYIYIHTYMRVCVFIYILVNINASICHNVYLITTTFNIDIFQ